MKFTKTEFAVCIAMLATIAVAVSAQQKPYSNNLNANYNAPPADRDYIRREVMIPMRDGVKLFTVIVDSEGAHNAPIVLTRTSYNAAHAPSRSDILYADALPAERTESSVRAGYIRVYQDVRGKYGSEGDYVMTPPPRGPAEHDRGGRHYRRVGHDRLAGEEHDGIEWAGGHDWLLVRGLHGGDGSAASSPCVEGGGAGEPDDRRLDGRRLVALWRFSRNRRRLLPGADDPARKRSVNPASRR